ncbi:DNA-3-methyladenine glycosylase I [Erysipelothrix sp. HDW6A]|uniref:DNA-3-methyladenine glycosylase I n=1 Tax=Erysipelothrix sp. HDW6A TaxID=2714928 RepID=UPI00140CE28A|nr:DNA-3-methyladenine glycosylase I [Erysipelothrix sp. HDW6A]QIK56984.1 DNA-3-methyladenine glycosylase I [Erysipelothrix sp. HDW6A]
MKRCAWAMHHEEDIKYHDEEWGTPNTDDRYLFMMLCLEGQQAGLSWITILKRRESMKRAYAEFDPVKLSSFKSDDVDRLLEDPGIIRHKLKVEAVISNAKAYLKLIEETGSLSDYLWSKVDYQAIVNHYDDYSQVPAQTQLSQEISKDLKKRGFKFVGPTIIYAFMQAVGMVNDHDSDCFKKELDKNVTVKRG